MQFIPDEPVEPEEEDAYYVYGFNMGLLPEDCEVTGLVLVMRVEAPGIPYPLLLAKESPNVADWEARSMLMEAGTRMFEEMDMDE